MSDPVIRPRAPRPPQERDLDQGTGVGLIDSTPQLAPEFVAALFASCSDPIIGEALDGMINLWNPAAERLYGYSAREAIGQPISILAPVGQEPELADLLEQALQGQVVEAYETIRRAKDGHLL